MRSMHDDSANIKLLEYAFSRQKKQYCLIYFTFWNRQCANVSTLFYCWFYSALYTGICIVLILYTFFFIIIIIIITDVSPVF